MSFAWTPHRFSGGALALDVANSVVLRFDPARRIDRFALRDQLHAFPQAAARLSGEPGLPAAMTPPGHAEEADFLALREAIDRYFRARVEGDDSRALLADLLASAVACLRGAASEDDLGAQTARSALRLAALPDDGRMKICGNCGWLFLDRSKNRSRAWCDMAVCGNRVKASRHYRRRTKGANA